MKMINSNRLFAWTLIVFAFISVLAIAADYNVGLARVNADILTSLYECGYR